MTDSYPLFSSYTPCPYDIRVKVTNGTLAPVAGKGSVRISDFITLKSVLQVPTLDCNLLSVNKLLKQSNCFAKFLPSHCVFQDLSSEMTIGSAKEQGGLYCLKDNKVSDQCYIASCNSTSVPENNDIMLWHWRMGHPSFKYLYRLFPSLCSNNISLDVHCEVCELAKHHRTSFPKSTYKPSKPFTMIHSDIRGPSRVPNRTHTK